MTFFFNRAFYLLTLLTSSIRTVAGFEPLADDVLRGIPSPGDDFDIDNGKLLAPILITRVPGTEGSLKVQKHFTDFFKEELPAWEVLTQNSSSSTPLSRGKQVPFVNYIFRRDPPWAKEGDVDRLTLVAHYDSKLEPEGFIGATDSAAPCAMLLHMARSIDEALTDKWKVMRAAGDADDALDAVHGVQILFLDGEEAFLQWTHTDSLYGARSLAEEWENTFHSASSTFTTPLQSISLFVLLDLLGSNNIQIPSYFLTTHWAYKMMGSIEHRMRELGTLEADNKKPIFRDTDKEVRLFGRPGVEDDHIPFMARGVDILHLIPSPFPDVWHKIKDDGKHLDLKSTRDFAKITTAFVAEWMELGEYMPRKKAERAQGSGTGQHLSKRTEL